MCGILSSEAIIEWRRVCSTTPFLASIKIMASSELEAPVTMFRVYCMWPGASAIINLRFGVEKYL